MTKELKVIEPFGIMDEGDTLTLSENGNYVYTESEEVNDGENSTMFASYNSSYEISEDYAKILVEEGYLEEVGDVKEFVNIFTEIDNLLAKYTKELNENVDKLPAALKVERTTVLTNMIKLLNHLKSLKK